MQSSVTETRLSLLRFRLLAAGSVTLGNYWRFRFHAPSYWRFYAHDRDGARLEIEGEPFPLESGRHYLIPAGLSFSVQTQGPVGQMFLHFETLGLPEDVAEGIGLAPVVLPPSVVREAMVEELNRQLSPESATIDTAQQWRLQALLYESFVGVYDRLPARVQESVPNRELDRVAVMAALRYIQDFYGEALDNAGLARRCSMSESHFIRQFQEHVGQTPGQFLLAYRLQVATERLVGTNDSIEEIARKTGFCHRAHFANAFKRAAGVPPATYRRERTRHRLD